MGVFRSSLQAGARREEHKERAEKAAAAQAEKETARSERATALISEVIDETAQTPAQDGGELLFTREQAEQMLKTFLERERALYSLTEEEQRAAKLDHDEMMLRFRTDLADHGLPADEIIEVFSGFDFTTLEGLRDAMDEIMELYETISVYSDQYEATLAAKQKTPPKNPDIISEIFRTGGHA